MSPSPAADRVPPGWHGKLPSLGDFASRRLARDFIDPWDGWLAAGLAALRDRAGESWLEAYLSSPSWRFLLLPGVLPGPAAGQAWAGVLMPSVDRVGRYFPFTVVQDFAPGRLPSMADLWPWLGQLDDLAADAMREDWTIERLETALAPVAAPAAAPLPCPAPLASGELQPVGPGLDAAGWLAVMGFGAWCQQGAGLALWQACPESGPSTLLQSRGLPSAAAMDALFGAASIGEGR